MKRVYGLDILRAAAILDILIGHSFSHVNSNFFGGFDGVNLFFVLSGFLIGKILIKELQKGITSESLKKFWYRRWMRTLPAYYFIILILIGYDKIVHHGSIISYGQYFFFTQWVVPGSSSAFPESWSLCIEEWFYLLIPVLFFIVQKFSRLNVKQIILFVSILAIVVETVLRFKIRVSNFDHWNIYLRESTFLRLDSIMFGLIGACFYRQWKNKKFLFWIGILIWIVSNTMARIYSQDFNLFWYSSLLTSQCVGTLLLIPYLNDLETGKGILFKFITFTSTISYSMYLLNLTPYSLLTKSLPDGFIKAIGCIVFTYLGAYIMYKLIEKPFMNLRDGKRYKGLDKIDEKEEYISIETSL